ncbi:hypothetical protein JNG56_04275 [Mycoplasmopsis bovis]|nr:hypothetical protein [Mycoplasmopsis bovis]UCP05847.1 hypothetical protein JNG56_04275 [Mycoplasmopsis bovis]
MLTFLIPLLFRTFNTFSGDTSFLASLLSSSWIFDSSLLKSILVDFAGVVSVSGFLPWSVFWPGFLPWSVFSPGVLFSPGFLSPPGFWSPSGFFSSLVSPHLVATKELKLMKLLIQAVKTLIFS